jgi:hypothetical protein
MQNLGLTNVSYAGSTILRGNSSSTRLNLDLISDKVLYDIGSVHGIARVDF